jgi:tRNA(fMet)-specific endonuclease VapC
VKPVLVDTDILSMFLRGHPKVVAKFEQYLNQYGLLNLSIITYYEIVSGLKHRDAHHQLDLFLEFVKYATVLPMTEGSSLLSAERYAALRKKGQMLDDIDLLIAGIALENNLVIVTHNVSHFQRIDGLEIEDWSQ